MTESPLQRVIAALEQHGRRYKHNGDQVDAQCPAHEDHAPSLSVRYDRTAGKVLVNCHTGCAPDDVIAALGLTWADLFDPKPDEDQVRKPQIVATYAYTDEHGEVLYEKVRLAPKDFRVRRPDGRGGWEWRIGDARRVLYRLPELRAAIAERRPVLLVEGEKDADRVAEQLGMAATCNYEGAAKEGQRPKWRREYTEQLRGAMVLIVADNDEAGLAHARAAAADLQGIAAQVGIFRPAVDDSKADISDHLDAGYRLEDLRPVEPDAPTKHESNAENEATKKPAHAPQLHQAALHGVLGDVVRRLAPTTEASPAAMLFQLIAFCGALLGDHVYVLIGGSRHAPRVWTLVVGPTSAGRKGESRAQALRFVTSSGSFDSYFVETASGLSTGEGLLHRLRDDEGHGKNLVVTETEFGRTLAASKREGNTISHVMRDLWDDGEAETMTKGDPVKVTGAHLTVIGHITPRELRLKLTEVDVAGGLANRYLYCWSHRTQLLPDQEEPPDTSDLARRLDDAVQWTRNLGRARVRRTEAADEYWRKVYRRINEQEPEGLLGELVARASAYVLRVALVFALLDQRREIDAVHLRAALACVVYSIRSAVHIFGDTSGAGDLGKLSQALKAAGEDGLTRSDISKLFSRNKSAEQISALVGELVDAGQVREITERPDGERGRPTIRAVWIPGAGSMPSLEDLLDEPVPSPGTKNERNEPDEPDEPAAPASDTAADPRCIGCGKPLPPGVVGCLTCYAAGRIDDHGMATA